MKVGTDAMVLGASLPQNKQGRALDIGSGTGVLALMLAQRNPLLMVDAVELDETAASEAAENFSRSPFSDQIRLHHCDILEFEAQQSYDLIVSNPPFFTNSYKAEGESRNLARHTERLPLEQLAHCIAKWLSAQGRAYVILPVEEYQKLLSLLNKHQMQPIEEIKIWATADKLSRNIGVFSKEKGGELLQSSLLIRESDGRYTEAYIDLTKDFHNRNPNGSKPE